MASLETRCEFRSSKLHRTLPGEQRQPLYAPTPSGETDRREFAPSHSVLRSHRPRHNTNHQCFNDFVGSLDTFSGCFWVKKVSNQGIHSLRKKVSTMAKTDLTWLEDTKRKNGGRWKKKYRNKPFHSNQPKTKAGKANALQEFVDWKSKVDQEFLRDKPHKDDYEQAIRLRVDMVTWLTVAQDQDPIKARLLSEIKILETELAKPTPRPIEATGILFDPIDRSMMPMSEMITWVERLDSLRFHKQANQTAGAKDNSLQQQIEAYINLQRSRAASGQIELTTFRATQERTENFKNWLRNNGRTRIDSAVVRDYHASIVNDIANDKISEQWGSNLRKAMNTLIKYLWRQELCELPRNLNDPMLHIKVSDKVVSPFKSDELQTIWDNAPERTRLYALLMLNCGMLPSDISDLKQSEYNGTHITRRRKKTGKQYAGKNKKVPMVSWLLWDTTKELLDKHRSKDPKWLLVNKHGRQILRTKIRKDGKVSKTSGVKSAWDTLRKKVDVRSVDQLRKTGASKLEEHQDFGRYSQFFLGQAPSSIAEKRYAPPTQIVFDKAMTWLGEQFNL